MSRKEEDEEEMIEYVNKLRDDIDKKQAEYKKIVFLCERLPTICHNKITRSLYNALLKKRKCEIINMPKK